MISRTDFYECEVLLPGNWRRKDNGDLYSFTSEKMELKEDRLYKQLVIRHPPQFQEQFLKYALTIEDDYCGLLIGEDEFIIKEIVKKGRESRMEWEDKQGNSIEFESLQEPEGL